MNEMFIMLANHNMSTHKRKVKANLDKVVCVYFNVKNTLGMSECWCEIKPKLGERKCLEFATANGKFFSFCFKYSKSSMWNVHEQQFDSKYFDWLCCGILL